MTTPWAFLFFALLVVASPHASQSHRLHAKHHRVKSAVFHSPTFELAPGSVHNKVYLGIDFPKGHIAIKEFNAELVDEQGNSIPLSETYLHHWLLVRYHQSSEFPGNITQLTNDGICSNYVLGQYYGLGSETRRTKTYLPDPYGVEVGNPTKIPPSYEEKWMVNVHAIDTRGVKDRKGCFECRCDLYNRTMFVPKDYGGGLSCCLDGGRCALSAAASEQGIRGLYLKYTVKWEDWNDAIKPVKIYILDVTYSEDHISNLTGTTGCQVEYDVKPCEHGELKDNDTSCVDVQTKSMVVPRGGNLIYGVAHQHAGGIGSTLYGQDGRVICSSTPIYGHGSEVGNERGYIVGMTTCYPKPGSVMIGDGEKVTLVSNYSTLQSHTGVMGLFYIIIAD